MPRAGPLVYDPLDVFLDVFADPDLAADIAVVLTCREVNALVGLLDSHSRPDAAARWLAHHLVGCDDRPRHLH
ncbi:MULTISPECIES: hypothetical protein [Actinosynnema]|uniref:hypothetical protein n=1 Tax=Actinosynnema TaxID=40566 RepID=UPI0020A48130|nr:hypothetical protein [Actinosynnema pretiosum]MCP2097487.1 hypothetical protein [Actinosynnema pretiosum]